MGGPWPPPRAIVEYVCPFNSSQAHFVLKLFASVEPSIVSQRMKDHFDLDHPGWTEDEIVALAAQQRESEGLQSAPDVRRRSLQSQPFGGKDPLFE